MPEPKNPWAIAFKGAAETWLRVHGSKFGLKYMTDLAKLLGIGASTWSSVAAAGAITKKEVYATLFLLMEIPEADPRTIPDGNRITPQGRSDPYRRSMTEDEWQTWLQTDPMAEKIRKFRAEHGHPVSPPQIQQDLGVQETTAPDSTDLPSQIQTHPISGERLLEMAIRALVQQYGTLLGETIAAAVTAGTAPILEQIAAATKPRDEEDDVRIRQLTTSPPPSVEALLASLISEVEGAREAESDVRTVFVETHRAAFNRLARKLRALGLPQRRFPKQDEDAGDNQASPAELATELADQLRIVTDQSTPEHVRLEFLQRCRAELETLLPLTQTLLGDEQIPELPTRRVRPRPTHPSIGDLVKQLTDQFSHLSEEEAPDGRERMIQEHGPELGTLLGLLQTLTLPAAKREQMIQTQRLGGTSL